MKKIFGVAGLLAALAAGSTTSAFAASCSSGEMIKFAADAFAYESAYNNATYISSPGSQLNIVGIVAYFCSPLAPTLDPTDPSKEYTFLCTSLTSGGTSVFGPFGGTTFYETDYAGGTWEVHEGSPRNAPTDAGGMPALPSALVPANFVDGPVVLSGTFANFHVEVTTNGANINGSFRSDYAASGGSYYPQVGNGSALFQGNWCVTMKPTGCTPATYSAHPDGKWDTPPTTATLKSTWGAIKQLYR
jgi:hypothetical protein